MGIIAWVVLGAIAGFLANLLVGGREGLIGTIILGIVGAVVGGWLAGTFLKLKDPTGINVESIVVAVFGAIVVLEGPSQSSRDTEGLEEARLDPRDPHHPREVVAYARQELADFRALLTLLMFSTPTVLSQSSKALGPCLA